MFKKLERNFYNQDALFVSKELIGKYLVIKSGECLIAGRINETECYRGDIDKACHAYKFKKTLRTEIMFGEGGFAYVYFIYGMHCCFNVVVEKEGMPCAVLIRGAEIVLGKDDASKRRYGLNFNEITKYQKANLSNGPGKLCKAMGINRDSYGKDLCGNEFFIASEIRGVKNILNEIYQSPRIGINYAEEAKEFPWRFYTG